MYGLKLKGWRINVHLHRDANNETPENEINNELDKTSNWLKLNELSLNIKNKYLIFHHQTKKIKYNLTLKIDNYIQLLKDSQNLIY